MRNRSLAISLRAPSLSPAADSRRAPWTIKDVLETVSETLWVLLLFMIIGFLVSKAPQINAAINEITASARRPAVAGLDQTNQTQLRELESRISKYEGKLGPLERNYAQLKQRHTDLMKAYDQLRKSQVHQAYAKAPERNPAGAP